MELKEAAYKTTELGLIPEDWSITTLSKVGSFSKGKGIKKDEVQTDGIPCVRYGELYTKYDNIITFFHSYISEEVAASSIQIKEGDILFAGSGETREEIGKCAAMLYADRVYAGGDIVVLRPNNFDSTFLGYLLNAPIIAKQKSVKGQGDAVVHIYSSGLANVKIPVPPPAEQKAIATALSDVDTLITNLDKLIAKKKAIKQGAMQRLLKSPAQGGQRLPGFEGEWVEKSLGEDSILKARIGWQGLTTEEYLNQGDYFLITGTDFNSGFINWNSCHFVEKDRYDQDLYIQSQVGDILITKDGTIGKVAFIDHLPKPATLNSGVFVVRPKKQSYHPEFLYHIFMSSFFKEFLSQLSAGSTINHLYQKDFVHFKCFLPPSKEEQKAIASILSDMDKEIESLEIKKSKHLHIKQGMMQELLTGKTRLV